MTRQELLDRLAAGNRTVQSNVDVKDATSRSGEVVQLSFSGRYISVMVVYPGKKFEVKYEENREVSYNYVRYLTELE